MSEIGEYAEHPVDSFIAKFLPPSPSRRSYREGTGQYNFSVKGGLNNVCSLLRRSLNSVLQASPSESCEPFKFYETHQQSRSATTRYNVDMCLYPQNARALTAYGVKGSKTKAHASFAWAELPVFVELDADGAPFSFDHGPLTFVDSGRGGENLARLTRCIGEIQLLQHRTFVFALWLQGDQARLMRWDRSTFRVSIAFNYADDPTPLVRFVLCLANGTPVQRGHDPSVTLAAQPEVDTLLRYEPKNKWERAYHAEMVQNLGHYPIRRVTCTAVGVSSVEKHTRLTGEATYLIGRHRYGDHDAVGRGAKCYMAYDIAGERLVFLKDFWYHPETELQPELETYDLLKRSGVRNIATVIAGGDVGGTRAQCTREAQRCHGRIVFGTVGRPLETHIDQAELIRVLRDALVAHSDAYTKAGILHADVSPGNILIDIGTGRGFLNDWHVSKRVDAAPPAPPQDTRAGTWMTMSARLLDDPYKCNVLADDLESFLHTAAIIRLRYYRHEMSGGSVIDNARNIELSCHLEVMYYNGQRQLLDDGYPRGGRWKMGALRSGCDPVQMAPCPLQTLLERLYELFSEYYQELKRDPEARLPKFETHQAVLDIIEDVARTADSEVSMPKTHDQFKNLCSILGEPYPQSDDRPRTPSILQFDEEESPRVGCKRRRAPDDSGF